MAKAMPLQSKDKLTGCLVCRLNINEGVRRAVEAAY